VQSCHASRSSSWVQISRAYLLRNCDKTSLLPIRPQIICSFRVKQVDLRFPATVIINLVIAHQWSPVLASVTWPPTYFERSVFSAGCSLCQSPFDGFHREINMLAKHEYFNVQCPDDSSRHALTGASTCYLWNFWPSANIKVAPLRRDPFSTL